MEIVFDTTPDETGKGRVIVDGRFYGLPVAAVNELLATKNALWKACGDDAEMVTEYIESQRVSNVAIEGPEQAQLANGPARMEGSTT